ncbi:MAG: biosynthetic-type acetolactate synthase large subunit [Thermodesulfobacteriota bacterium]
MKLSGAKILIESLKREGVEVIFGYPGAAITDIHDKLADSRIKHILVRHEQAAVHAADGYARASGKVGVVLVTSGPGATNTVTGIATAYMDSIPVVVLTGQVPRMLIGNDAFQEVDIVGITRSCTKHNYLVQDVEHLAGTIKEAFYLAASGRPGPILVDLPKDVIKDEAEFKYPRQVSLRGYQPHYEAHPKQVQKALDMLLESSRPVIYAGGGVIISNAHRELKALAEMFSLPVTTTLMGLGGFPASHELWLGMLGMHGTFTANMAVQNCDLLLAVGARFDDRVTGKIDEFCPKAKIVHIDIDPTSIRKNVQVHVPIVADCRRALNDLLTLAKTPAKGRDRTLVKPEQRQPWLDLIKTWRNDHPLAYEQASDGPLKPQFVIEEVYRLTRGKAVITTEVGQNQMWAAQYYHLTNPRTFITSGGLGCMGYGLPAAIGAQVARPEKTVIDIAGDGSIQMNIQELATAVQYNLPVKVVILNNQFLGMVRQWQQLFYDRRYCATAMTCTPDFVRLAEAYGAVGFKTDQPGEVAPIIQEALKIKKPVLMDFRIEPEECVYPMVPAGSAISNMLLV